MKDLSLLESDTSDEQSKELAELASIEKTEIQESLTPLENEIVELITPNDEVDDRDIVLEVRAGTGMSYSLYSFFWK